MMTRWMTRIARLILRADTYRSVMEPAIADAQYESANAGRFAAARQALWLTATLILATLDDLQLDVHAVCNRDARRTVWMPALRWSLGAMLAMLAIGAFVMPDGDRPEVLLEYTFQMGLAAIAWTMVPAAFRLVRQGTAAWRPIAAAALIVAFVAWAAAFSLRPIRDRMDRAAQAAMLQVNITESRRHPDHPFAGLSEAEIAQRLLISEHDRRRAAHSVWIDLRSGAYAPAAAVVGISLSLARGWTVGLRLLLILVGAFGIGIVRIQFGLSRGIPLEQQGWLDLAGLVLAAAISLAWRPRPAVEAREVRS